MLSSLALQCVYLCMDRFSPYGVLVWEPFLRFSLQALEIDYELEISNKAEAPTDGSDFAFLSGLKVLSSKRFLHFDLIYIFPHALKAIDSLRGF